MKKENGIKISFKFKNNKPWFKYILKFIRKKWIIYTKNSKTGLSIQNDEWMIIYNKYYDQINTSKIKIHQIYLYICKQSYL